MKYSFRVMMDRNIFPVIYIFAGVGIPTGYGMDGPALIPGSVQTGCGVQPPSHLMGTERYLLWAKVVVA
jgi:hypothetical protein